MKSIKEKAEAYDKVLEWATEAHKVCDGMLKEDLEHLFPELKESEDERIRKGIIKYLEQSQFREEHYCTDDDIVRDYIAWLEKQGEQSICKTPSREIILAIWDLGNEWKELTNGSISTEYSTQLDYIQKHWQESEYYLRAKQGEQKSITPKFKINDVIKYNQKQWTIIGIDINNHCYDLDNDECVDFDTADYNFELVEQKPTEWSEEDEVRLDEAIQMVEANGTWVRSEDSVKLVSDWLKSLRPRNRWKPSDEQMITLRHVISGCSYDIDPLVELETKLKEL